MAPIHQDRQLGPVGPPDIGEGVEGGPDRAARVQDVVDDDHALVRDVGGDVGRRRFVTLPPAPIISAQTPVVPVLTDVELTHRHLDAFEVGDETPQESGQMDTSCVDPDDDDRLGAAVALQDLVGDATDGSLDVLAVHHLWQRGSDAATISGGTLPISLLPGLTGPCLKARRP